MYTEISKRKQGSLAKIFTKDVLKRQILTDSIAKNYTRKNAQPVQG